MKKDTRRILALAAVVGAVIVSRRNATATAAVEPPGTQQWHRDRFQALRETPTAEGNAIITAYGSDGAEAFARFVANPI